MSSGAWDERVATLTREIASHAQSKQLDAALAAYATIEAEGRIPTKYTHSAIVNAHVNSGDLEGAARALARMEAAGHAPNIIVYTTMLKGHCTVGDLAAARNLLESMSQCTPPIRPDARTLNTFMRGCVRVGDLAAAKWAFEQLDEWKLTPSAPSTVAMGRLLSQGLELRALRKALEAHVERAQAPVPHRPTRTANRCAFWEKGRCDRGLNCNFYHDPAIRQNDAHQVDAANRDTELELCVHLAHAAALLGKRKACTKALGRADELQQQAETDEAGGGGGSGWSGGSSGGGGGGGGWEDGGEFVMDENRYGTGLHAGFRRAELRRECERIRDYLSSARPSKRSPPRLDRYLTRCLVFATRLLPSDAATTTAGAAAEAAETADPPTRKAVVKKLVKALKRTAGLAEADRLGLASRRLIKKTLRKAVSEDGRLRWGRLFRALPLREGGDGGVASDAEEKAAASDGPPLLPVKLEIASGTGDWVVAQARSDVGKASWACVELRHDRVYHTLSLMALHGVPNLCVMGGDAALIVRSHLATASVSHAFINFPEPPSGYLGLEADNSLHLLTPAFFTDLHRVLVADGYLTIFSDNGRYCRALAVAFGKLRAKGSAGSPLFSSVDVPTNGGGSTPQFEKIGAVKLYYGVPGHECGHVQTESSYFDRLWEYRQGEATERFYMHLRRETPATS